MLGQLRGHFEPIKARMARPLARLALPPLAVTLMGIPLSLGAGLCLLQDKPGWALALAMGAGLADFLDGAVARAQNRVSLLGNYLEAVVDKVVEMLLLLFLAVSNPIPAACAMAASMLVSYCKPRLALCLPIDNSDWPGIGDHADRLVLILFAYLFQGALRTATIWLLVAVALVGLYQRLAFALSKLR